MSDNGVPQYNAPKSDPAQPYPGQPGPNQPYQAQYPAQPYQPQYGQVPPNADPLDLPLYGAGPILAVKRFFQNYAKFTGRASRAEFWWVQLIFIAVYIVLGGLGFVLGAVTGTRDISGELTPGPAFAPFLILLFIISLGSIVPNIAVTVRRLHDAGMSGLLYLVTLFPYLGSFVLLILCVLPPKPEGAIYDRFRGAPQQQFAPGAAPFGQQNTAQPTYAAQPTYTAQPIQQAPPAPPVQPGPPAPPAPPAPPVA